MELTSWSTASSTSLFRPMSAGTCAGGCEARVREPPKRCSQSCRTNTGSGSPARQSCRCRKSLPSPVDFVQDDATRCCAPRIGHWCYHLGGFLYAPETYSNVYGSKDDVYSNQTCPELAMSKPARMTKQNVKKSVTQTRSQTGETQTGILLI